ncbi:MAG: hypothetical protein MZV65_00820 [Chromatiales bacterium]|nr:hypothetical protein [Chromatiales bacterium]
MKGITKEENQVQYRVFSRMSYDEKLTYCDRPEQDFEGPSEKAWQEINAHLDWYKNLPDLVRQLGERRFGHTPRVGDAPRGGGSVPFEAARIGCEAYGSDLNPVAALLTWGALNIVGGGEEVAERVRAAQRHGDAVDRQITAWGIEHNEEGDRADAYLYCTETRCPECGWSVPLAPSWVIGEKTLTLARLVPDEAAQRFAIEIHQGNHRGAARTGSRCRHRPRFTAGWFHRGESMPMTAIHGDRRTDHRIRFAWLWENEDLVPRPDDVFQERAALHPLGLHTWIDDEGKHSASGITGAPRTTMIFAVKPGCWSFCGSDSLNGRRMAISRVAGSSRVMRRLA